MDQTPAVVAADLQAVKQRRMSIQAATGSLQSALNAPAAEPELAWLVDVEAALVRLRQSVDTHITATEGPGGFHQQMVTAAPRLVHQTDLLTEEHRTIVDLLSQLEVVINEPGAADQVRRLGPDLVHLMERHHRRGADVIFEAFLTDLGAGD